MKPKHLKYTFLVSFFLKGEHRTGLMIYKAVMHNVANINIKKSINPPEGKGMTFSENCEGQMQFTTGTENTGTLCSQQIQQNIFMCI